jgi:hypothetical protein
MWNVKTKVIPGKMEPPKNHTENTWATCQEKMIKKLKKTAISGTTHTFKRTNVKVQNIQHAK